jgi:hypothetical protein
MAEVMERRFAELDAPALDAELPFDLGVNDRSILGMLAFIAQHESYHIGQLSLLRKHVGLPAMRYG